MVRVNTHEEARGLLNQSQLALAALIAHGMRNFEQGKPVASGDSQLRVNAVAATRRFYEAMETLEKDEA